MYGNDNEDGAQHEPRNIMIERLLKPYNDALNFPDHVLMGIYRLPRRLLLNQIDMLWPALERPTRRHVALPVVVRITNALRFFAKSDFQTEVADLSLTSQPCVSRDLTEVTSQWQVKWDSRWYYILIKDTGSLVYILNTDTGMTGRVPIKESSLQF